MLTEATKLRIADRIAMMLEGLAVDDAAEILTVQLAMLTSQGAESPEDAIRFLDEIRDAVEAVLTNRVATERDDAVLA